MHQADKSIFAIIRGRDSVGRDLEDAITAAEIDSDGVRYSVEVVVRRCESKESRIADLKKRIRRDTRLAHHADGPAYYQDKDAIRKLSAELKALEQGR